MITEQSSNPSIRPLRLEDRRAHDLLMAELDQIHHEALPSLIKAPGEARLSDAEFYQRLADPAIFLRGYEVNHMLVGLIRAELKEKPEGRAHRPARLVRVEELIVSRQARGSGSGYALLQAARFWAEGQGASSIELNVYSFNVRAMDFYNAAGFAPHSMILSRSLV